MKKLFTLSFFLFSFCFCIKAQPLYLHWTRFIGGEFPDGVEDAIVTADSSVIFVGYTSDTIGNYDVPASPPDSLSILPVNLFVGKMNSSGQLTWVKVYGGSRRDRGLKLLELIDGTCVVLGHTRSFDGNVSWNRGSGDIWLLRIDAQGNLLSERTYGSSAGDVPFSIALTSDGGFLIVAESNGSDYDAPFHYGPILSTDWLVIKIDSIGDLQWSRTLGGTNDEGYSGSIFEANGGYYLVSQSSSYDHDCNDSSWHAGPHNDMDYYMLKLDTAGNVLWSKSYGGTGNEYVSNAMWDERDSTVVITGMTQSTDFMVQNNYNGQYRSIWVIKTDKDGNFIWGRRMGDTITDNDAGNILPYKDGGYIMSGTAYAAFQLQPGHIGAMDAWVFMLDSLGHPYYDKIIGGIGQEVPIPVIIPFKSGYAIAGTTFSYTFTEGTNMDNNHSSGPTDIYISALFDFPDPLNITGRSTSARTLTVWPNPSQGYFRVSLPVNKTEGMLQVTDISGKLIYKQKHTKSREIDINTARWAKGAYIVKWITELGEVNSAALVIN